MTHEKKERVMGIFFVSLALLATFLIVYSPHFSYKYPIHVDEWQHIAKAVHLIRYNKTFDFNPYLNTLSYTPNLEKGMTVFLAEFSVLAGLDPVQNYRFLPALFAAISAFMLFSLVYSMTKEFYAALFSIIFFAALKSNINIMGLWFFTPLTFSIPFIYLSILMFIKGLEEKNNPKIMMSVFLLGIVSLIQPLFTVSIFLIYPIFLIINAGLIKKNARILSVFIIIPILFLIYFFNFFWRGGLSETMRYISSFIVFQTGWGHIELRYFLPSLYGIAATLLAILGIYPAMKRRSTKIFIIWAIVSLILIYLFRIYSFSLIAPYQRMIYFCMLGMVPLSAMGLGWAVGIIRGNFHRLFRRTKHHDGHLISNAAALIIVVIVIAASFNDYYAPPEEDRIYNVIEDKDYGALIFLERLEGSYLMAPLRISSAVYPISKNLLIGVTKGNLPPGNISEVEDFYKGDCEEKRDIIERQGIELVLSEEEIGCDYFDGREIYNQEDYIYSFFAPEILEGIDLSDLPTAR